MRAIERRLARLGLVITRMHPPPPSAFDPAVLTAEEMEEAGRISAILRVGGLAALSDADLDLAECLRRRLIGEDVGPCLG